MQSISILFVIDMLSKGLNYQLTIVTNLIDTYKKWNFFCYPSFKAFSVNWTESITLHNYRLEAVILIDTYNSPWP